MILSRTYYGKNMGFSANYTLVINYACVLNVMCMRITYTDDHLSPMIDS